jgi:hypothetical protein
LDCCSGHRPFHREETTLSATAAPPVVSIGTLQLGFLTVLHEANGYLGGYLAVNGWGRPLEFRLTSAVQPNRVQQILYGGTLETYVCADLIGKTLVEKAGVAVQLVVTDREEVLDLRLKLDVPVAWLTPPAPNEVKGRQPFRCHPRFEADSTAVHDILERLDATFDLAEPFQRIREAIGEARKMGVAAR